MSHQPMFWNVLTPNLLTIARSPLCAYFTCDRKGRAEFGQPRQCEGGAVNQTVRCLTCGSRGEVSYSPERAAAKFLGVTIIDAGDHA